MRLCLLVFIGFCAVQLGRLYIKISSHWWNRCFFFSQTKLPSWLTRFSEGTVVGSHARVTPAGRATVGGRAPRKAPAAPLRCWMQTAQTGCGTRCARGRSLETAGSRWNSFLPAQPVELSTLYQGMWKLKYLFRNHDMLWITKGRIKNVHARSKNTK